MLIVPVLHCGNCKREVSDIIYLVRPINQFSQNLLLISIIEVTVVNLPIISIKADSNISDPKSIEQNTETDKIT